MAAITDLTRPSQWLNALDARIAQRFRCATAGKNAMYTNPNLMLDIAHERLSERRQDAARWRMARNVQRRSAGDKAKVVGGRRDSNWPMGFRDFALAFTAIFAHRAG